MMNFKEQYIKQYLKGFELDFPEEDLLNLISLFHEKSYQKGDHLVEAGNISYFVAFITEGLVRFYLNTHDGKQFNQTFKKENDIIVDYFSALINAPAYFSIQALEPTKVFYTDYRNIERMYLKQGDWNKLGRLIIEKNFIIKARREAALLQLNTTDRYLDFRRNFSDLFDRLSQQDVALYLGVDPATLNRLIKKNNLE